MSESISACVHIIFFATYIEAAFEQGLGDGVAGPLLVGHLLC